MPELHYSNRLDRLIEPLAENLDAEDPFEKAEIVVPNFSLQKWISLQLAQRAGIAANLRFIPLEKALQEMIQFPLRKPTGRILISRMMLQRLLLERLRENAADRSPIWEPLQDYLKKSSNISDADREQRLFQLSERMARLFQDYEYSRNTEILGRWKEGKFLFGSNPSKLEHWQRELWLSLFGPEGCLMRSDHSSDSNLKDLRTLSQLYDELPEEPELGKGYKRRKLHIFGLSYFSHFHQQALTQKCSRFRDIHVYALNPCMEFWENLQSVWEKKQEMREKLEHYRLHFQQDILISESDLEAGELIRNEEENPFLQAWGRPGRENIRLLNEWREWQFDEHFHDPQEGSAGPTSLLCQIQHDILVREPRREKGLKLEQDQSLQLLACTSPRREAEAVGSLIWEWVHQDPELRFNEIAVVAYEIERYQHEVEDVFQSLHGLPCQLIDGVSGSASRLQEATKRLLELCDGDYTREELFRLILNPCFLPVFSEQTGPLLRDRDQESFKERWLKWTDELGILFGLDQDTHNEKGFSHLPGHLYHWDQGLRRLAMGRFLGESQPLPGHPSPRWAQTGGISDQAKNDPGEGLPLRAYGIDAEDHEEAARFVMLMRSLMADTRDLSGIKLCGKDWGRFFRNLFKTYIGPSGKEGESEFQKLGELALSLEELDLGRKKPPTISFHEARQFFLQQLEGMKVNRGHYLAEGVTLSSYLPMRPIPFKVVFLLGMGEGRFPTSYRKDHLDLRHVPIPIRKTLEGRTVRERQIGDVSVPERDRYMFLETLVSTQERMVLSYICRDDRTDDELKPSSVVQTLVEELNHGYLKESFQTVFHPLKNYAFPYFFPDALKDAKDKTEKNPPNWDEHAFRQATALGLRNKLEANHPVPGRLDSETISSVQLREYFSLPQSDSIYEEEFEGKGNFSLNQLRAFLECPLQSNAKRRLFLPEDEEDLTRMVHEPVSLEPPYEWQLLQKTFDLGLLGATGPDWIQLYREMLDSSLLVGALPTALFEDAMRRKHIEILSSWERHLRDLFQGKNWSKIQTAARKYLQGPLREDHPLLQFGKIFPDNNQILQLKPALQIPECKVDEQPGINIRGESEWTFEDPQDSWKMVHFPIRGIRPKHWIRLFLNGIHLAAGGIIPEHTNLLLSCVSAEKYETKEFLLPDRLTCRDYLAKLAYDMRDPASAELFPVEAVLELQKDHLSAEDWPQRLEQWLEEAFENPRSRFSSQYGPLDFPEEAKRPDDPKGTMENRFGLLFNTIGNPGT